MLDWNMPVKSQMTVHQTSKNEKPDIFNLLNFNSRRLSALRSWNNWSKINWNVANQTYFLDKVLQQYQEQIFQRIKFSNKYWKLIVIKIKTPANVTRMLSKRFLYFFGQETDAEDTVGRSAKSAQPTVFPHSEIERMQKLNDNCVNHILCSSLVTQWKEGENNGEVWDWGHSDPNVYLSKY